MRRIKRNSKVTIQNVSADRTSTTLQRNRRAVKRSEKRKNYEGYAKRKWTTDKVCQYILFPVVPAATGKPNDFYLHALSMCWNDKNITKDYRCQQLLRGLSFRSDIPDLRNLKRSSETGWFQSSRKVDLARIGQVAGIFLHKYASSVGAALDEKYRPGLPNQIIGEDVTSLIEELKDDGTVLPVIVKMELSADSYFDSSKFIRLNEHQVNLLATGDEIIVTSRVKLLKITTEFINLAWNVLNSISYEVQKMLLHDITSLTPGHQIYSERGEDHMLSVTNTTESACGDKICSDYLREESPAPSILADNSNLKNPSNDQIKSRANSCRVKTQNKKYSSEAFVLY